MPKALKQQMKKSKKNNKNDVKEPTQTPSERRGDRAAEKTADKIKRIQRELIDLKYKKHWWGIIPLYDYGKQYTLEPLNSEKKRRIDRETMLKNELAKANEQLKLKAELEQSDDC